MIDVQETKEDTEKYAKRSGFTFPVLLDLEGKVSATYAPAAVLPDLKREQVPIASNLILDRDGKIRFYTLLDTTNFDARLVALRAKLDKMLATK